MLEIKLGYGGDARLALIFKNHECFPEDRMTGMTQLLNVPTIVTTLPDGRVVQDTRPGHSVSGLMFYLDPFIRYHGVKLRFAR